ncbi:sugar transferase [Blastochloris sulfoviridis]|uniref:Sugar transferase n=1 Tax=Blastochloris sulfoviridis TaxID=50712 RepID=A0A5M6I2W4_9HYPH|nr:sugar transferase [Blastochloris sulfoviridis]KAA5602544.1 sugar transferase [Blastochloris sulfoviridis]
MLVIDLLLILAATVFAILLRDNLEFSEDRFAAVLPYLLATLGTALIAFPLFGVTRAVWKYSSMRNYIDIVAATGATVIGAVALAFVATRLDGTPRALPIIQALLIMVVLIGARIAVRMWHARRCRLARVRPALLHDQAETVLVVGLTRLAELYLHCVADFAPDRIHVAGVLDPHGNVGRVLITHPVLGTAEQVSDVIRTLEVHGVFVDRVIIALPFRELPQAAQRALLALEAGSAIALEFLDQRMGLDGEATGAGGLDATSTPTAATLAAAPSQPAAAPLAPTAPLPPHARVDVGLRPFARSRYWAVKRLIDIAASSILLLVLAPVMAVVALAVAADVGSPVLFWQQRPGRRGRPFRVYKFRTMGAAHDASGRRRSDAERVSAIGQLLRRTRLDELPQLFSILLGHMSFVGPRPLLPVDQPAGHSARLLVRPGLTGWAQIKGGRIISAEDKAALDVWYVRNASLALDLRILLGTIPMVLFGERVAEDAIAQAWRELQEVRA